MQIRLRKRHSTCGLARQNIPPDECIPLEQGSRSGRCTPLHAARSAVHQEVDQYEDENVGAQALSEGEKAAGNVRDISKSRYARKLKKKAKMQGKKGSKTAKSSASEPTASTRCRQHPAPARAAPTGFPGGGRSRTSGRAIMPPPVRAQRRRPQAAKRHPTVHLLPGPAWNRRWTKAKPPSAPP